MQPENRSVRLSAAVVALLAGGVVLLGVTVLLEWYVRHESLAMVGPDDVPIEFNAGLGFVLGGIGLLAGQLGRLRLSTFLGAAVGLIGASTLVAYAVDLNFGIDALLTTHARDPNGAHLAQATPSSALCVVLSVGAILCGASARPAARANMLSAGFSATAMGLCGVALFGRVAGVETGYGWFSLEKMAGPICVGFVLIGLAALVNAIDSSRRPADDDPVWLPLPVGVAGITVSVALWHALSTDAARRLEHHGERVSENVRQVVARGLASRIQALERMARRWEARGGTPRAEWEADALEYTRVHSEYRSLEWVNATFQQRWVVPKPRAGEAPDTNGTADEQRATALVAARLSGRPTMTGGLDVAQDRNRWLCTVPVEVEGRLSGLIVGVFDVKRLLDLVLAGFADGYDVAGFDPEHEIYRRQRGDSDESASTQPSEVRVTAGGLDLKLVVRPSAESGVVAHTRFPIATLLVGLVLSTLLAVTVHILRLSRVQQREADIADRKFRELNATLEAKVAERTQELARERHAAINIAADAESAHEKSLEVANALKRSNEDLEQFASVASHDLQEPLRMVASYTELLAERYKGQLDDKADLYIHFAVDGAKRMQFLLEDLLTFARVGSNGAPFAPFDTAEVLYEVQKNLEVAIRESGCVIVTENLPAVMGDRTQFVQLFQNLVSNAIKFRAKGAIPEVRIVAEARDGHWQFAVQDNGPGIAPEYTTRIFGMFQRLHERGRYEGTGIGLTIAKKIVDRHGGRIWVESSNGGGGGARFCFSIPQHLSQRQAA